MELFVLLLFVVVVTSIECLIGGWSNRMENFLDGLIAGWLPSMIVLAWMLWRVPAIDSNK